MTGEPRILLPAAPVLRDYQTRGVDEIRTRFAEGSRRVIYQAPTGSGKTVLFAYIVAGAAAKENRVAILAHRQEIVDQISEALAALAVPHGMIAAGHPETVEAAVQVASVATLVRRLDRLRVLDLLVIDEAHHAVAGTWRKILEAYPNAKALGVTATPERLDGQGLSDVFDVLVTGPAVAELIAAGYLARFVTYAPPRSPDLAGVRTTMGDYKVADLSAAMSKGVVITGAVDEYARRCPGEPAIVFCVDIAHSQLVAAAFAAAGYRAAHVDGDTAKDERRALISALGTSQIQVLCNCGLISEGLDVPGVVAAVLLRPTKSLALYLQQVGRALRPAPNKQRALILDHAGNTYRFGLADAHRVWSLDGRAKRGGDGVAPSVRRCPECGALVPAGARECPACGAEEPTREHTEIRPPSLERVDRPGIVAARLREMSYSKAIEWAGRDLRRLHLVASARGYKTAWVWHRLREAAS